VILGLQYPKSIIFVLMKSFRGKKMCLRLQLLTLIIFPVAASAQSTKELKEIFAQAESYYLYEDYELANQLYIIMENPDNLNLSYKIGTCYLNIPDEKEKAIPYLEAAVKNAVYDAKPGSFKEKRAPLDAWFYLGKAYMINNELEKGLSTLQTFANLARDIQGKGKIENLDFVDQQIMACKNAIKFEENPVALTKKTLGPGFSQGSMNENPAVSFDGNTIAYTERRGLVNVILFSKKIRGKWQNPVEITGQLNAGDDCSTCALNADGTELFLYKTDMFDGNIYSSKFINDKWTPIVKLNKNINTKFYESHASVSADGKRLFFTSNREGGQGGLDIYMSEKDITGDWGEPVNLGTAVNTPYNEDNPFVTANDSLLYFCSEGHNSMGGFDNFRSRKMGKEWSKPESLGYPVNTTDNDKFLQPSLNGMTAYYSMKTDYKKRDIFYIGFGIDVNQIYEINGNFRLNDTAFAETRKYSVHVLGRATGDTLYTVSPDNKSGFYTVNVSPGTFRIAYSGDGYFTQTIDTAIIQDNPDLVITLDVTLRRDSSLIKPVVYEKINLAEIPVVAAIDTSILIKNMLVSNVDDVIDSDVLYYTVQVMALHNPVDISYFKYISDMKVMYNDVDKFYRYTSGRFATREEAVAWRLELIRKGYPEEIFIKKVSK
jgi:tetratricopeptide (TPR) repeat protein